jgi:hypothetical protein
MDSRQSRRLPGPDYHTRSDRGVVTLLLGVPEAFAPTKQQTIQGDRQRSVFLVSGDWHGEERTPESKSQVEVVEERDANSVPGQRRGPAGAQNSYRSPS